MSSNEMENEIDSEISAKRLKIDDNKNSSRAKKLLSKILQREIRTEIKLRSSDLETIEENIFLTKQYLLKLRQGVASDYYKERNRKDCLQYPPHPAIQDTFKGKSPRNYIKTEDPALLFTDQCIKTEGKPEKRKRARRKSSLQNNKESSETAGEFKPCHIQPKPAYVEAVKPPEPRGFISKKQIRIVVGNVSKWLAPEEASGATHKWTVYTKTTDASLDLSAFVSKVVFFLHPSYKPNDSVSVENPPFKLTRRGWGEFPLKARFHFKNPLDNPVDVVHVLKLDYKNTGLETFGAETVLAVWIHLPSEDRKCDDLSSDNFKKCSQEDKLDLKAIVKKEEPLIDVSIDNLVGSESLVENNSLEIKSEKVEVEVIEDNSFFKLENWEQDRKIIYENIISNDNSHFVNYESNALHGIKNENDHDGLDFLINNDDNTELSQLSNALIEEVINGAGFLHESSSMCNDRFISVKNEAPVSTCTSQTSKNLADAESLNNQIKTELEPFIQIKTEPPESFSYDEQSDTHPQEYLDDFLDECNVVESEVVIDCDSLGDNGTAENSISPDTKHSDSTQVYTDNTNYSSQINDTENSLLKSDMSSLIINAPLELSEPDNRKSFLINNSSEKLNQNDSLFINTASATSLNSGITQINITDLQNASSELTKKHEWKGFSKISPIICQSQKVDTNLKIATNNVLGQPTKVQKPSDTPVKAVIGTSCKQLNSIEITDNGKTIATGMVPVVKVLNSSSSVSGLQTIPRKVIVRKLNGEIATILAPISQDALSKSLKSNPPTQLRAVISTGSKPVNQLLVQNQEKNSVNLTQLAKNAVNISNIGNSFSLGSSQKLPFVSSVKSISLQPTSICIPVTSNLSDSASLAFLSEVSKPKKKNKAIKEVKSTIIMLQKENGEVILKKEAKFSDRKDGVNSLNPKKSKVAFELAPLLGNKKGNGKEVSGAVESNYLFPFVKCNKNNVNPSLIKLQHPMGSKISIVRKDTVPQSAIGGKGRKNTRVRGHIANAQNNLLPNSSPLKGAIPKQIMSINQRNFSRDFKTSLLLSCPVQSTELAVSWLVKKLPLVDKRADIPAFRSQHPYCAKSLDAFLKWPYGKQRAAEWGRAKRVVNLLNELDSVAEKWTTFQVYDWARIRAFTPLKINSDYEAPSTSSDSEHFYIQPTSEIIAYIKKCKNLKELAEVDVHSLEAPAEQKNPVSMGSPCKEKDEKKTPIKENNVPFEPELEGLRQYVNLCLKDVGAETSPEEVVCGVSYSAAERMLISVFHSLAEDIIRRSYNASWIRHDDRAPSSIIEEDVRKAILSRKELDFLVPSKVERKERPPVTVLPNFS